jgi:Heavy metal binding domain
MGLSVLAGFATLSGQPASAPVALRFHHLHYRVADPGAALGDAAETFKGARTILQGLGVGVRVGRQYVLIDRADSAGRSSPSQKPAGAYAEAVLWLRARGVPVEPASLAETAVARTLPDAWLDHVAFAADTLGPVLASLQVTPSSVNADRALFTLPSGAVLEIVRDTDRPDVYWCPMHPDVRSSTTGTCRLCAMALVPIPPPRLGEYKLDVTLHPRARGGASGLRLAVRDPETGAPVTAFIDVHERPFHLFILSRDLSHFAHVHPEPSPDGAFDLRQDIETGEYMLIADFLPAGGTTQLVQRAVVTPGYIGPLFGKATELTLTSSEQAAGGLRITMDALSLVARRESAVRFHVSDATTGLPVSDLEPYLGASGHLLVVNHDVTAAIHAHPEGVPTSGPIVAFAPVFPAPGRYKMWVQLQRKGTVVTAAFVIEVPQS